VAALKVEGTVRSSRFSSVSRKLRRRGIWGRGRTEEDLQNFRKERHMVDLLLESSLPYNGGVSSGAQTERWGMPGR
jgi:hypothetical protein